MAFMEKKSANHPKYTISIVNMVVGESCCVEFLQDRVGGAKNRAVMQEETLLIAKKTSSHVDRRILMS